MALNHHPNLTLNHLHIATNNASSSSSSSCRSFPLQDDQGVPYVHPFIESKPSLHQHEVVGDVALGRKKENNDLKLTILKRYNQDHHIGTSSSPTALKMRFLQKSMTSNYYQTIDDQNSKRVDYFPRESNGENSNNNNESCGLIRACSDCGTTRTPLWRSGPHGPKSLCNACGIRQRKARRAAMALAASDDTTCATNTNNNNNNNTTKLNLFKEMSAPKIIMKKRSKNNNHARKTTPHQTTTKKKISFQEFALNLSKKLSLHHFFQQDDEKEAAILLMALSSGFRS